MIECEAPESNNTCTELLKVLPIAHAVLTMLVFCDTAGIQSKL